MMLTHCIGCSQHFDGAPGALHCPFCLQPKETTMTKATLTHIPSPGECTGLRGTALCGRTATYRTGDHDLIRRRAMAALLQPADADDCPECRAILAGQWIRTRRGDTSQAALAQRIGVAPNTIARYERGEMAAPLTVLLAVDRVC